MSTFERMLQVLSGRLGGRLLPADPSPRSAGRRSRGRGVARGNHGRSKGSGVIARGEQLEQRLALAIDIFSPLVAGAGGQPDIAPWFVVTSDQADDVYVKQVATVPQDLFVADNASFNNYQSLRSFHAEGTLWNGLPLYSTMYVTNGTKTTATVQPTDSSNGTQTTFVLSQRIPDRDANTAGIIDSVTGTVSYGGNRWSFTNNGSGSSLAFTLVSSSAVSDPAIIRPVSGAVGLVPGGSAGNVSAINILWSAPALEAVGISGPRIDSVTYVTRAATATAPARTATESFLAKSSGTNPIVQLPVTPTNPGGIVPGTLSGFLLVDGFRNDFRVSSLFRPINSRHLLLFSNGGAPSTTGVFRVNEGTPNERSVSVTAEVLYDYDPVNNVFKGTMSGGIKLEFREGGQLIDPGAVSLTATYATYNQDARASSFTLAPGLTFEKDTYVDLLTPGSQINIDSPLRQVAQTKGGQGELSLRATTVTVNAPMQALSYLDIGSTDPTRVNSVDRNVWWEGARGTAIVSSGGTLTAIAIPSGGGGQGYDDTVTGGIDVEIVGGGGTGAKAKAFSTNGVISRIVVTDVGRGYTSLPAVIIPLPQADDGAGNPRLQNPAVAYTEDAAFNARVEAPAYDIRIADDPSTAAVRRGRMFVSSTGSLTASNGTAAGSLYVQADTSDVYVEGTINVNQQSYLFRSPDYADPLAPYRFTTVSPQSGVNTGLIQGGTVAVTLGNDLKTVEQQSVALNVVDLRTSVGSMRVRAATRKGEPISGPFPYELNIQAQGDVTFDAVAASGRDISLNAAGKISFTAGVATWGNLTVAAGGSFDVTAPLSSARGQVGITGQSLTVSSSVRVLASAADATRDDIVLTATGGDLSLSGAIAAVNGVRLVQRNAAGKTGTIAGPPRIIADRINVESAGAVSLRTDAIRLAGIAAGDFAIDELNDITVTSLRSGGFVTLRAGGVDPGLGSTESPNAIALKATLYDVNALDVSAPRGSVDVVTDTSKVLTVGNVAAIANGKAVPAVAAGSVTVRSLAGPVVVADAPLSGAGALQVRVATQGALSAVYSQQVPGQIASTLTGGRTPLVVDGVMLRVGDRVLVTQQARPSENGVYTVTSAGSLGREWKLTRSPEADTSLELTTGLFVRVLEGTHANVVLQADYSPVFGTTPVAVTSVPNRVGAEAVRAATASMLPGTYDPVAGTITGAGNVPVVDGVAVRSGDRVLVRYGTTNASPGGNNKTPLSISAANGVYEVVSVGGVGGSWLLSRAGNVDTGDPIQTGYVIATEGSYRDTLTGQAFAVSYDAIGVAPLEFIPLPIGEPATDIGTEDINDTTTFVVSSTAGTNDAAGSLGKMLSLMQANDTSGSLLNPNQKTAFAFALSLPGLNGAPAGVIRLTQELPAISKAFAIDGAVRTQLPGANGPAARNVFVDGSRIATTRLGQSAAIATEVNGFEFLAASSSAPGKAGGAIANLTVGGFANGAAVKANGASGVLVNAVTLGSSETGDRLANKFGVLVTGAGGEATVLNSRIVGSTEAGIRVAAGATRVTVVGSTVGAVNQANRVGIDLEAGVSRIGLNPLPGKLPKATVTNGSPLMYFNAPAAVLNSLYVGQTLTGNGIPNGTVVAAIHGPWITMSKAGTNTLPTNVRFGLPTRNVIEQNLTGVLLSGGSNIVTNSDIGNNVYEGIRITGGSQYVGLSRSISAQSNQIYANGRAGVAVYGSGQVIVGNMFGARGANRGGNVLVNDVPTREFRPLNPRGGADRLGNHHAPVNSSAGTRKITWRG